MEYTLKSHLFDSLELANAAIKVINQGEGIPISSDAVTQNYTSAKKHNENFYIEADETTIKYLGLPIELNIKDFEI
jgi:hypothetical protein